MRILFSWNLNQKKFKSEACDLGFCRSKRVWIRYLQKDAASLHLPHLHMASQVHLSPNRERLTESLDAQPVEVWKWKWLKIHHKTQCRRGTQWLCTPKRCVLVSPFLYHEWSCFLRLWWCTSKRHRFDFTQEVSFRTLLNEDSPFLINNYVYYLFFSISSKHYNNILCIL